jgi:cytochrome c
LLASANPAEGEAEAKNLCSGCHHLEAGNNYDGPSLWNVVGRPKGSVSDFKYSQIFSTFDRVWTFDALNEFLARSTEIIPGTSMNYRGLAELQKRANLIACLRTLSDAPVPLP